MITSMYDMIHIINMSSDQSVKETIQSITTQIENLELQKSELINKTIHHTTTQRILNKCIELLEEDDKTLKLMERFIYFIIDNMYENKIDTPFECCICKVTKNPVHNAILGCGHKQFCYECIEKMKEENHLAPCPLCRKEIAGVY